MSSMARWWIGRPPVYKPADTFKQCVALRQLQPSVLMFEKCASQFRIALLFGLSRAILGVFVAKQYRGIQAGKHRKRPTLGLRAARVLTPSGCAGI
jgi:hypothetical protein